MSDPIEAYRELGLHPIILHGVDANGHCTCGTSPCGKDNGSAGKHPVERAWQQSAPADVYVEGRNVGLRMGKQPGGLWLLALDEDEQGAFDKLEAEHGPLPPTWTQQSGSGGRHRVFQVPAGFHALNHKAQKGLKLDVKYVGGQIVAEPSVSARGPYVWLEMDGEPAMLPAGWLTLLSGRAAKGMLDVSLPRTRPQGKCAFEADRAAWAQNWCLTAPVSVDGASGGADLLVLLTDLIVGLELDPDVASDIALEHYNPRCKPPWSDEREWQHKVEEAELNRLGREPGDLVDPPAVNREWLAEQRMQLYSPESVERLARLKMSNQAAYETAMVDAKAFGAARLREAERLVTKRVKQLEKERAIARLPVSSFTTDEKGRPVANELNVVRALVAYGNVHKDEFSGKIVVDGHEWTDTDSLDFTCTLQEMGCGTSPRMVSGAIASSEIPRVHAVRDYLSPLEWDGIERLDLLPEAFGVETTPLTIAYWRCWMLSAVRRVFNPGVKADCMIILYGKEGLYKSTGLKVLGGTWFADTPFDIRTKDAFQVISGVWVYELADWTPTSKSDVEATKNFLSSGSDRYRPSYGRHAIQVPRQTVFAGTTNVRQFLTTIEGDRRLWIMTCIRAANIEWLVANRDQLWAESLVAAHTDEKHFLEDEMASDAAEDRKQYREGHVWEERVTPWLAKQSAEKGVLMSDVLSLAIGLPAERWEDIKVQRTAGKVMRACGWEKDQKTVDGLRGWRWFPKASST